MAHRAGAVTWRKELAAGLDLLMLLAVLFYPMAWLSGGISDDVVRVSGWAAVVLIAAFVAYFNICYKMLGGPVWERLLGVAGPGERS